MNGDFTPDRCTQPAPLYSTWAPGVVGGLPGIGDQSKGLTQGSGDGCFKKPLG